MFRNNSQAIHIEIDNHLMTHRGMGNRPGRYLGKKIPDLS
jgi:hypothetical protein